jgi:chaperonin GroES
MKDISKKVKPLLDRVVLREIKNDKDKKTSSGIFIPSSVNDDKGNKHGEVVALGAGRVEDGKLVPLTVKIGDKVLYQWAEKFVLDGEDYYILRESEILAILK